MTLDLITFGHLSRMLRDMASILVCLVTSEGDGRTAHVDDFVIIMIFRNYLKLTNNAVLSRPSPTVTSCVLCRTLKLLLEFCIFTGARD